MKKTIKIILTLSFFYIVLRFCIKLFGHGHNVQYQIKDNDYDIQIQEEAVWNKKNIVDHYFFTIKIGQKEFSFQTNYIFKKKKRVIKQIEHFKNDTYECVYPISKNGEMIIDVICQKDDIYYYYQQLKGKSGELDKFVRELEGYPEQMWEDQKSETIKDGIIEIYPENLIMDHSIGMDYYSGIYVINNKQLEKISIFKNDIYERKLDGRVGPYYITADYNQTYDFTTFYLVNLTNHKKKTIKSRNTISFDSYIEGSINDSLYIFDKASKKQYKIDEQKITEIGNEKKGIQYYNLGKWENKKAVEALTEDLYFNLYQIEQEEYERVDRVEKSGYIYYYKKIENGYQVYRSNINQMMKTYLFSTSSIENIQYVDDYVYFKEGTEIKYYHDTKGVRTIASNSEFLFNDSLNYYVYINKKR